MCLMGLSVTTQSQNRTGTFEDMSVEILKRKNQKKKDWNNGKEYPRTLGQLNISITCL